MNLKNKVVSLLTTCRFGVLATSGTEYPHCSRISYAFREHPAPSLVFATDTRTRKYDNLQKHPAVAFLVSLDGEPPHRIDEGTALTLYGTAAPADDPAAESDLRQRHPELAGFLELPDTQLIRITLKTGSMVTGLNTVENLTF